MLCVCCDTAGQFLSALMQDGMMNEAALCSKQLDRMYGPLREQVGQSLKRQDIVLRQLKVARVLYNLFTCLFFRSVNQTPSYTL